MRKINRLWLLLVLIAVFLSPVFAQEVTEELASSVEEIALEEWTDEGVITGDVVSLDLETGSITVKAEAGDKTFSVVDGETILWKGIEDIELADVNQGEETEVGYYTDEGGNLIASWVDVLIEEESPLELELKEETAPPSVE